MFAPTQDRLEVGQGFTHVIGDIATVATPTLGALVNRVNRSDRIPPWTFGTGALMNNLARRNLLSRNRARGVPKDRGGADQRGKIVPDPISRSGGTKANAGRLCKIERISFMR
jgi:hypothetical protein